MHRHRSILARRRGTSLIEGLIASVLLATSVVGIGGAISASIQNQQTAELRRDASRAGRKVMETITALPMDPATAGQASLADYQPAANSTNVVTISANLLGGILPSVSVNALGVGVNLNAQAVANGTSAISVDRRATLNGTASSTGDFALVTVLVPTDSRHPPIKLRRLVTSAEAAANQAP